MIIIAKIFVYLEVCLCFTGDCDNNSKNICLSGSMFVFYRGL